MDSGSQCSYVSNQLKMRLKLNPLGQEQLTINTFGNEHFKKRKCDLITVRLGKEVEITAISFPAICSLVQVPVELDRYPHLQELDLADASTSEHSSDNIDMLIGSDHCWDIVIGDLKCSDTGPVVGSSKFGWLLSGPVKYQGNRVGYTISNLVVENLKTVETIGDNSELDDRFWDIEVIGITEEIKSPLSQLFVNLKFDWTQGRYQVNLPWKADYRPLNNGYELCKARLSQLRVRLQRDRSLFQEYNDIFQTQLQEGIIEQVPDSKENNYCHFLSHHGVKKMDRETTKLCIVFDASSKVDKAALSLNDCLEKGPNGIPHLFDILLKF